MGADATLNYKLDPATQLSHVESVTGGNFSRAIDASGSSATGALDFLSKASKAPHKHFSTVDDYSTIDAPATVSIYRIILGTIGQSGEKAEATTGAIASYIPCLEGYLAEGSIKPMGVQLAGTGFEAVPEAIKLNDAGSKGGKKIVVKLQDL
jgi:hypothetical protein